MYIDLPGFIKRMFPGLIWNLTSEERCVYLTFDDGPNPEVTPWVLQKLAEFNAKATFFCLGKNVEQYPDVFQLVLDGGHAVGNHSYSHLKGWGTSVTDYVQDFDLANDFIRNNIIRPPYGRITPTQARVLNERYKIIMWDVLSRDYSRTLSRRGCVRNVVKHIHNGAIIVFHDSKKAERNLRYALPRVLEILAEQQYDCKAIEL